MRATPPLDAVIFDMDGVLTDTASLHAAAWKELFDTALAELAPGSEPFDMVSDYRTHVDGRPREDGVRTFLASRSLTVPEGSDSDPAGALTVHGLAARKNESFTAILDREGVDVFPGTVGMIRRLREGGVRTGLVTASRNAPLLLERAGLAGLFDTIVDGETARELELPGKPAPDTFLEAASRLSVAPARAAVLEDAVAGVRAAVAGGFGFVAGIDRHGSRDALAGVGAHVVVGDAHELDLGERRDTPRTLRYLGTDDAHTGKRAALTTLANGYFSVRGTAPEVPTGDRLSPGTYMAGIFNRLTSTVQGREQVHESMVNLPHWAVLDVRFTDGEWLSAGGFTLSDEERVLSLEEGVLSRTAVLTDHRGRSLRLSQRRLISMHTLHLAAQLTRIEPLTGFPDPEHGGGREDGAGEHSGARLIVRTGIDARVLNDNVAEYHQLAKRHLETRHARVLVDGTILCEAVTLHSRLRIAMAQRTDVLERRADGSPVRSYEGTTITELEDPADYEAAHSSGRDPEAAGGPNPPSAPGARRDPSPASATDTVSLPTLAPGAVFKEYALDMRPGALYDVDTTTAAVNSRDAALSSTRGGAVQQLDWLPESGFAALVGGHRGALRKLWDRFGVEVEIRPESRADISTAGHTQLMVDLHTFHLLQALSQHTSFIDAGTTARGLTGEGYRGHIFWDEVFILPLLNLRMPEISKALLLYRWRRLGAARHLARESGHSGAQFPWQSGSDGREETPVELWNPRSQRWMPDNSRRQYHVGLAIAYNAWQHYRVTAETKWLAEQGGELLVEVVRLFASMAEYDAVEDRFHIRHVMGPDEYHDGYPGSPGSGVDDNAYTNVMVAWAARHAVRIFEVISSHEADELIYRLDIEPEEIALWERMAARLYVPFGENGLISQFAGYDDLVELDWDRYRRRYGNIGRMDLIMESEDDATNNYRLSKQADVTMLFFLLGPEGVVKELQRMGYEYSRGQVEETIDYYVARSTDGSSLSRVVNTGVLAMIGRSDAWEHWQRALRIDIDDTQWGSTSEGVHLGAMAGTVDVVLRAYAGVRLRYDRIEFHPHLPERIGSVRFRVLFQGQVIEVHLDHEELELLSRSRETHSVRVRVAGGDHRLEGGARLRFSV